MRKDANIEILMARYAEDELKFKEMEQTQRFKKEIILGHLLKGGEKTIAGPAGRFTVTARKTWTYTEKVTKLEDRAKTEKAKEQQKGVATFIISTGLTFTAPKNAVT